MEKRTESLFKTIIDENFQNLRKELYIQAQEANRTLNYFNSTRHSLRLIILKLSEINNKDRILKVAKGK